MASKKEKPALNFVHQNAILCETIKKEQQNQKLYTNYSVNPFTKSKYCSQVQAIINNSSADTYRCGSIYSIWMFLTPSYNMTLYMALRTFSYISSIYNI